MRIWRCSAEAKLYNPHIKDFDPRMTSEFFIGYLERSKGFRFYCSSHTPQIMKIDKSRFPKNYSIGIDASQSIEFEKIQDLGFIPTNDKYLVFSIIVPLDNIPEKSGQ